MKGRLLALMMMGILAMTGCTPVDPPPPAGVDHVEISRAALILKPTERIEVKPLAYDIRGNALPAPVGQWSTDDPSVATVDSEGQVTAVKLGTTRLHYRAGAWEDTSEVTVAEVAVEVHSLEAQQVVGKVAPLDAAQLPLSGARYHVTVRDSDVKVGETILSRGEEFFAGRVIQVEQQSTGTLVTFERVSPQTVFSAFHFQASGRLAPAAAAVGLKPQDVQLGDDGSVRLSYAVPAIQALAEKSFPLGPFTCTASTDIVINPSSIEVKLQQVVDFDMVLRDDDQGQGRLRFKTSGQLNGTLTGGLKIGANFTGKIECKKPDLLTIPIPVTGPLAWFASPVLSLGFTLSAGGAFAVGAADLGFQGYAKANMDLGFEYTDQGGLTNLSTLDGSADLVPRIVYTGTPEATFKAEIFAGPTASLGLGNTVLHADLLALSLGPVLEGDFASPSFQVADATYSSGYNFRLQGKVEPGSTVADFIKYVMSKASTAIKETALALTYEVPVSTSPTGSAQTDVREFKKGETVTVTAALDAANTDFLGLYNVDAVELYRMRVSESGARQAQLLGTQSAAKNQENFSLTWVAEEDGKIGKDFFLFVRTTLLPFLPLEVANVQANPLSIAPRGKVISLNQTVQFTASLNDVPTTAVTWKASGGSIDSAGAFQSSVAGTFTVDAVAANGGATASTRVIVRDFEIRPAPATLKPGEQVQFHAYLDGKQTAEVEWSSVGGDITANGLFTAPQKSGSYAVQVKLKGDKNLVAEHSFKVRSETTRVTLKFNIVKQTTLGVSRPIEPYGGVTGGTITVTVVNAEQWTGSTTFEPRLNVLGGWRATRLIETSFKHDYSENFSSFAEIEARCFRQENNVWDWKPLQYTSSSSSDFSYETIHFAESFANYRVEDTGSDGRSLEIMLREDARRGSGSRFETSTLNASEFYQSDYPHYCTNVVPPSESRTSTSEYLYVLPPSKTLTVDLNDFSKGERWMKKIPAAEIGYGLNLDGLTGDVEVIVERVFTD
ncbi:Ig-like domain-containing protein [Deinococcus aquatilis]|uniref:Ig-like domain-containing protein n=1 Tax=Deinococcus aquatilis TaxID=519440 RepID=UPI0003713E15|nr:Ig-like domain-containing protein [Deinococcus aquatilis]